MDPARVLIGLDAEQHLAVTIDAAPLAIVAAAGSGKTRVLTRRIAHRVATGACRPAHVLALTFTRDAAGELRRRLRQLDLREPITAGTFHGVALGLLRDRALTRHEAPPSVAQDRLRLVREAVTELKLGVDAQVALTELDWARARLVEPVRYPDAVRGERRRTTLPPERFAELYRAYGAVKRSRGVVDFDDLLERCMRAMQDDPTFADVVRWRFRHLYVDEAQDLNPLQHQLLEMWRGGRHDLTLVGDPRQAIYGWNGADPRLLADVEQHYPGITVVHLTSNYRCTEQVVAAGGAALLAGGATDDSVSRLGSGPAIRIHQFATDTDEAAAVAQEVRDAITRRSSVAVLARTNEQLTPIATALADRHVPVRRAGGRRPIDLVLAEAARTMNREQLSAWVDEHGASTDPARRRVAEVADRYLSSAEPIGLRAWVERHDALADVDDTESGPAVELLSFHAAKGREWDTVVVIGVEAGLVPHASAISPAQREEETRLLYVAITRAGRQLVLTHAARRRARVAAPSPWLAAIAETSAGRSSDPDIVTGGRGRRPDPLAALRDWRDGIARVSGMPAAAVCSDRELRRLHDDPPADVVDLAARLGITVEAARRLRPLPVVDHAPDGRTPPASSR